MSTSNDLIAAVKRVAFFPDAQDLTDTDMLLFADDQINTLMAMTLKETKDEWWVRSTNIAIIPGTTRYRLPARCLGRAVRAVFLVYPDGTLTPLDYINLVTMSSRYTPTATFIPEWFSLESDSIYLGTVPATAGYSLKVMYLTQPSRLVELDVALRITSVPSTTQIVIVGSASTTFLGGQVIDVISGRDPHDIVGMSLLVSSYDSGTKTITLDPSTPVDSTLIYTSSILTGGYPDYVSGQGTTPYPQIPECLMNALSLGVAASILASWGNPQAGTMKQQAEEARQAALATIAPRDQRNSETIVGITPMRLAGRRGYNRGYNRGNY